MARRCFCWQPKCPYAELPISPELSAADRSPLGAAPVLSCSPSTLCLWPVSLSITPGCHQAVLQFSASPDPCLQMRVVSVPPCSSKCIPPWCPGFVFFSSGPVLSVPSPHTVPISLSIPVSWIVFMSQTYFPCRFLFSCLCMSSPPFVCISLLIYWGR